MSGTDVFFEELTKYFHSQYDFFKDNPWFDGLEYHITENFHFTEGDSILDIIAIILAISYAVVKTPIGGQRQQEIDPYFLEKVNVESGLQFPLDTSNMGLNKKMYIDFLVKIYEHSKKRFLDKNLPFEKGPGETKRLSDKAFDPRSLYSANERWLNTTTPGGRSVWQPAKGPYEDSIFNASQYAEGKQMRRPLDINVVGPMGQAPKSIDDIMMRVDRNEALERSRVYSQLLESNSDGEFSDETIANMADDKIRSRGYVTGVDDRNFNAISNVYKIAYREDLSLQDKVYYIKGEFINMVPYVLEKLILQADMGFYGKYDPKNIDYNYIKKRTAYKRLKLQLDVYDNGTPEQLKDVENLVNEVIIKGAYDFDRENNEHYKDENKTVIHPEELMRDDVMADTFVDLNALSKLYYIYDVYRGNVDEYINDFKTTYRNIVERNDFTSGRMQRVLNSLLNEMDDLLVHEYATAKLRNTVYDEGVFSNIMGQSGGIGIMRTNMQPVYEFRQKILEENKLIPKRLKVLELEIYEKLVYDMFRTFVWDETNLRISNIHPSAKEAIMELYAHCDILREQLHPTKDNPPLIPLPHLREDPLKKFEYSMILKMIKNELRMKEIDAINTIKHIIGLNELLLDKFMGFRDFLKYYKHFKDYDVKGICETILKDEELQKFNPDNIKTVSSGLKLFNEGKLDQERIDEFVEQLRNIVTDIYGDDYEGFIYSDPQTKQIFIEKKETLQILNEQLETVYLAITGNDVIKAIQEEKKDENGNYFFDYNIISVMVDMDKGITGDVKYTYRELDSDDPKGDEQIDEEMIEEEWLERSVYRKSIRENRPEYLQKKISDYSSDPFSLEEKDLRIVANLPKAKQMDQGQRARLQSFLGEGGELPQDIDNDKYDKMISNRLLEDQKRNYRGLGLGDYLTSQPAFSEAKQFGRLNTRKTELKEDMKNLVRKGKKYTDPEVVQIESERRSIGRQMPGTLTRVREMNPRMDFKGLSSGKKWKHSEADLMELKDLLSKSNYDMVSAYTNKVKDGLEWEVVEQHGPWLNSMSSEEVERALKPLLTEKIIEELREESLDDSDIIKYKDEKIDIRSVADVIKILDSLDTEELLEKTQTIYQKYLPEIRKSIKIHENFSVLGLLEIQGEEEELREKCKEIIMTIIRITYLERSNYEKNFDFNLLLKKEDGTSRLQPTVYNTPLYEDGALVRDPYGDLVRDYSRSFTPNQYDYLNEQYKSPEEFKTFKIVGTRDGEPLYEEEPMFVPSESRRGSYTKSSRFKGGGKKRTGQKKRTPRKK